MVRVSSTGHGGGEAQLPGPRGGARILKNIDASCMCSYHAVCNIDRRQLYVYVT